MGLSLDTQPLVAVVIVNWNGAELLNECLTALLEQSITAQMQVIVVDNGSIDASRTILDTYQERITTILNPHNVGFATGSNQGIRASTSSFVALLNNDAIVEPAWLAELVAFMQLRPEVGMCTSKLLSYYDRRVIDNVGHVVYADGLTRGRGRLECDTGQYDEPAEVFSFSGCAALLRRTMLDDVGFFDEEFFAYCEDADLGWRARLRGWTCWYVPTAVAYHKFSASSEAFSPFKALHVERNRLWLAVKNLPWWLLIASPWWTAQRYWWQAYGALRGQGASGQFVRRRSRWQLIRLLLQAYLSAAQGLGRVIGQRRQIQRRQLVDRSEIDRWLNDYGVTARHIGLLE